MQDYRCAYTGIKLIPALNASIDHKIPLSTDVSQYQKIENLQWVCLDINIMKRNYSEDDFLKRHEGSPIRRIGYQAWQRNLAVGMGNALRSSQVSVNEREMIQSALQAKLDAASPLVKEHILWALSQNI